MAENTGKAVAGKSGQTTGMVIRIGLRLIAILLIVLIFHLVISFGYDFGYNLFAAPAMSAEPGREVTFTVEQGESSAHVIEDLKADGLIRDKFSFRCQMLFYDKKVRAGTYKLTTAMTSKEILRFLDKGPESQDNH